MPTTCCVVNCGSRGDRDGASIHFYKIPSELHFVHKANLNELSKTRRQKWIQAIRRADITEKTLQYAKVCSKHFVSGKPAALIDVVNIDWVPSLALGYGSEGTQEQKQMKEAREERAVKRRLVDDQVATTSRADDDACFY